MKPIDPDMTVREPDRFSPAVEAMAGLCCVRNVTVRECRNRQGVSLSDHLNRQNQLVLANRKRKPLRDPEDFVESASSLTEHRLGKKAAEEIRTVLRNGVICTADHHGGLFGAQSLQGDLLYTELLKGLGAAGRYIPILSGGQIDIGNVTYARGICVYTAREEKQYLPIFRERDHNVMAMSCPAVSPDRLRLFRKQGMKKVTDRQTIQALEEILGTIYENEKVQAAENFAAQVTIMGTLLSRHLFSEKDDPVLTYLEVEEVVRPLLHRELSEEDSLIGRMIRVPEIRKKLSQIRTGKGVPLSDLLFGCPDERGRKVFLRLDSEGNLLGRTIDDRQICLSADPATLTGLLEERRLVPGLFTIALLLAFERGITWMGGMFQSQYLPDWQRCTVRLLEETGSRAEAEIIREWVCTGYLNGPMYALYPGDGYAQTAGPVEMWIRRPSYARIRELIHQTDLWDAHRIGLSEMYYDLSSKTDRPEGWYRLISEDLFRVFPENLL